MKYKRVGSYCHKRVANPRQFDKRSFRTVHSGSALIVIGCPKGKWDAKKRHCKVGTRAQRVMVRPKKGRCPPAR